MATKPRQDVAPAASTELVLPPGISMEMLQADSAKGLHGMGQGDIAIPYLYILQPLSPQIDPNVSEYVQGAIAGMLYNNVSNEAYEGKTIGVRVVSCAYERKYEEWTPRDRGGGWVRSYDIDSDILNFTKPDDKGKPRLDTGNLIVETAYHYSLLNTGDDWVECIIPFKSTALKKNRRWNHELTTSFIPGTEIIAPRWLFPYQITTMMETKGDNRWFNFVITKLPDYVSARVYEKAKRFNTLMEQGLVRRAPEGDAAAAADAAVPF